MVVNRLILRVRGVVVADIDVAARRRASTVLPSIESDEPDSLIRREYDPSESDSEMSIKKEESASDSDSDSEMTVKEEESDSDSDSEMTIKEGESHLEVYRTTFSIGPSAQCSSSHFIMLLVDTKSVLLAKVIPEVDVQKWRLLSYFSSKIVFHLLNMRNQSDELFVIRALLFYFTGSFSSSDQIIVRDYRTMLTVIEENSHMRR